MSDSAERTEQATPKRMQEVRREGRLSSSRDMTGWISMAGAALVLPAVLSSASASLTGLVLGGLFRTFDALPVTGMLDPSAGDRLLPGVGAMFLAAVQIAGPIVVVLFLADVGLGLLTRVAPALNAFQLGYPLKILITLLAGGVVFLGLPRVIATLTDDALRLMGAVS